MLLCLKLRLFAISADSPHPSSKMVHFILEEQGSTPAKMVGSTKCPSGLITSPSLPIPKSHQSQVLNLGDDCSCLQALASGFYSLLMAALQENESLGGAPLGQNRPALWPCSYFRQIPPYSSENSASWIESCCYGESQTKLLISFLHLHLLYSFKKIITDKLQSHVFLEFLCS